MQAGTPPPARASRTGGRHQTNVRGLLALACACLAACAARPLDEPTPPRSVALGPWLTDAAPTSVSVAWTTARPTVGKVRYGAPGGLVALAEEEAATTDHRLLLTGLRPASEVDYQIVAEPPAGGRFATPPDPAADPFGQPFSVLVYGDNRTNGGDHALVVRAAEAQRTSFALHTGDMVVDAKDQRSWERWFQVERDLLAATPFYPTVGNHEITDQGATYSRHFQQRGRPTYRSFDYGNVHVQVLDSFEQAAGADPHAGAVSEAQQAWAEEDARSVPKDRHLWMLVHQGPATHPARMRPGHGGLEAVRRLLSAVAARHPVEAVFAGHEHFYERGEEGGLRYFVVGGGGAPLEEVGQGAGVQAARSALGFVVLDVCGCHVTGRALDIAGATFDSFVLSDCPTACRRRPGGGVAEPGPAPTAPQRPTSATGSPP
jgi:hypothetical protein